MKKRLESGNTPLLVPSSFLTEEKYEHDPENTNIKPYTLGISPHPHNWLLSLCLFYNKFIVTLPLLPHPCLRRQMISKTSCIRLPNGVFLLSCLQDTA